MGKAVFLDLHGVGVRNKLTARGEGSSLDYHNDWEFVEDVTEQLKRIKGAGYFVIVAINQPRLARVKLDVSALDEMRDVIISTLPVDDMFVCPHDDNDNCECRKPKTGLIMQAKKMYDIDLGQSFLVGDTRRDMETARNAGCRGIIVGSTHRMDVICFNSASYFAKAIDVILTEGERS